MTDSPTAVHVVPHTHWDREWYHTAVRFRQRLVALVDELLDSPPPEGSGFLLDGQAVVLEDYLAVRPQRAGELTALLQAGSLEAGPWYVLADELIPGAESHVRNLLAGRRALLALGASAPPVLYCPDSFGHPAALPMLARGFGCDSIIAWRGFGSVRWPPGDAHWWAAPAGERVLLYHLSKSGYELGANLPADATGARARWTAIRAQLVARSRLGSVLLLNGADHHARQRELPACIAALALAAQPDVVSTSSLRAFAADATQRAAAQANRLPTVRGELRDSYGYTWTLQGTLSSRAAQKRRHALVERALVRDTEPWVAFAAQAGGAPVARRQLVEAAWRSLLLCQPHDTLCGCSVDEVALAMDVRLAEAGAQADGLRADAIADLIGHDAETARGRRDEWRPLAVVRNRAARAREGVAVLSLSQFVADAPVGPGSSTSPVDSPRRRAPALTGVAAVQLLDLAGAYERTESPRHYPNNDLVGVSHVAAWVGAVPAYGIRCYEQGRPARRSAVPNPARATRGELNNTRISVHVHPDGRVAFVDHERARSIAHLLHWESLVDLGDLYTPSPRGPKCDITFDGVRRTHRGPVRAGLALRFSFRDGRARAQVVVELLLDADSRWLRIGVTGHNASTDHRLRLRIATDVPNATVAADAMFGVVTREPLVVPADEAAMEFPLATAPLHRYVSLYAPDRGATVFSDGLAEYEAGADGSVSLTLLRAVGELSRADLPERPGHAGWPAPTPAAQCAGPFAAEFALMLHDARSPAVLDDVERAADDILLPLTGESLRSALHLPNPVHGVELEGAGLAFSAAKESEDGAWLVLRCVNLTDESREAGWRLAAPVREAYLARLDETPLVRLEPQSSRVGFTAAPRATTTILVR